MYTWPVNSWTRHLMDWTIRREVQLLTADLEIITFREIIFVKFPSNISARGLMNYPIFELSSLLGDQSLT